MKTAPITIERFVQRFDPCNSEDLMRFDTLEAAWVAERDPGNLIWATVHLADDPQQWRVLLADILTKFYLPVWEATYPDDRRVKDAIEACRSGDFTTCVAADNAATSASNAIRNAPYNTKRVATRAALAARAASSAAEANIYAAAIHAAESVGHNPVRPEAEVAAYIKTHVTWVTNYTENDTK